VLRNNRERFYQFDVTWRPSAGGEATTDLVNVWAVTSLHAMGKVRQRARGEGMVLIDMQQRRNRVQS